ncbi:lysine histidine transporter-like 6 [Canna indica]|uniref:Lysine histidine transporter-like 6 n=1 Tax=Canna indica TaxID=4628 RepID=A0AAQ3L3U5_9LILI|nr:lysine histidine transporter-like 6 [Canna indica]
MHACRGPGALALVVSWCITLYTLWLMIQLHECVPGTRFDRYRDLGRYAFGPRLGPWIVVPQQLIVQVGCDTVYMVTGGQCLGKFVEIILPASSGLHQSYWICIFGSIQFFLSQMPDLNSMAGVSLAAAVMSLSYSTISWATCLARGPASDVSYALKATTPPDSAFRVFNALGQVAFAYAGHGVVLEIQATIPSTPTKPSRVPMWKGTVAAYLITALCYFPVAVVGYWTFGRDVDDNVLMALQRPRWLIAAANLMVVIHVIGSYQVYAMPVFDSIETILVTKLKFTPGITLRLIARSAYVAFTLVVGVTFPFFADLLGFFGGFGFTPTSYFLPCVIWLAIKKPKRFSLSWLVNWGCIILGVIIMVVSTVGGLRNIIKDSSTYRFYS